MALFHISCEAVTVLQGVVEATRGFVAHKSITVDFVFDNEAPVVVSDPDKLRQIVTNIMNNAARLTARGRITLILGREGHCLKLTVTDTGTGIAKDVLTRWRSPAFGDSGKRRVGKYIGPDLIMTRKLVELLGGGISISSRSGAGTIVEVWLPLIENRQREVAAVLLEMSVCHA